MSLAEEAKRVAAEFDFGPSDVRKAVKEFIREMGMLGAPTQLACDRHLRGTASKEEVIIPPSRAQLPLGSSLLYASYTILGNCVTNDCR